MRFIKGAASKYLGATLNAGPTSSTPAMYGTPEWKQAEQAMYQRYKSGQAQPGLYDYLKASSLSNVPENVLNEAKNFNPIDTQKFDSGDVGGGLGSTAMNLLLLRQAFKGNNLPVMGRPAQAAERVQPLTGYTKVQPQSATTQAPSQATPSNATLPNATYLQPEMRALLRPKETPPSPEINKNTNTLAQEYFIQKMREQMNRQTVTGSAEQDAAIQRMNEYAKSPFDRATASGPVESPGTPVNAYRYGKPLGDVSFYSKNADYAQEYATVKGGKPSDVTQQPIQLKNPKVVNASDKQMSDPSFESGHIKAAQAAGNDGVIFRNGPDEFYAVFNKPQSSPQFAYRTRDAGETGIMPNSKKTAQASLDPTKVQSYQPGRASAQNHPQEMVRIDLSKLDPSEYEIAPNGYVNFKSAVPESFIEKMGSKAIDETQPRVPTSDADLQDLLMKSIQRVKAKAKSAKAGD